MSELLRQLSSHWQTALEHTPFIVMAANGAPRLDWKAVASTTMSGIIAGALASYITLVRIEERVAEQQRRIQWCEDSIRDQGERFALIGERIARCEAKH